MNGSQYNAKVDLNCVVRFLMKRYCHLYVFLSPLRQHFRFATRTLKSQPHRLRIVFLATTFIHSRSATNTVLSALRPIKILSSSTFIPPISLLVAPLLLVPPTPGSSYCRATTNLSRLLSWHSFSLYTTATAGRLKTWTSPSPFIISNAWFFNCWVF